MASGLSSNWKALQARIQDESTAKSAPKRKADVAVQNDDRQQSRKKQKLPSNSELKGPKRPTVITRSAPPKTAQMGGAQSSKIDTVPESGVSPSLALWAADNDISTDAIAEAYGLGLSKNSMLHEASKPNEGLASGVKLGKYLAVDCEMVGVGENGYEDALARVSVVDFNGRQIYDSFVRPVERVADWRTHVSGVSPKNMRTAREFDQVQTQIAELLKGRILVGHDIKHDLGALKLDHPVKDLRDTAKFSGFKKYGNGPKPALRVLAHELLGVEIQTGEHSSIEDARVTMVLFRKHKPAFDIEHANRYPDASSSKASSQQQKQKKAKKKRRN